MGWRISLPALALIAAAGAEPAAADLIGDATRGAKLFGQECQVCHRIGAAAAHHIGPRLNGVFGRRAGSHGDYPYSKAMARMGADGLVWTLETLDAYIANPRALVSRTRMTYAGMPDATARADLLAFLRQWSDRPGDIPEAEPTARQTDHDLDPALLTIKGDAAYGEYLSSECLTCHRTDGSDHGIPSITNWPEEDFVVAMHAYRRNLRPHPVMQMMAQRLSPDEIAALAAYFASID